MISLLNSFFYRMRSILKFRRGGFILPFEEKEGMYDGDTASKEWLYREKYQLKNEFESFGKRDYSLLLYHLELLEFAIQSRVDIPKSVKSIDVGSKNFHYVASLRSFYRNNASLCTLKGIEVDAFRVYDDFHSRFDYAKTYIKDFPECEFLALDFLKYNEKANIITMFLPFVYKEPLLAWGLPVSMYVPEKMMMHAYSLLEEGGIWIITNQGMDEYEKQQEIFRNLNISYVGLGKFNSDFFNYPTPHYVSVVVK